MADVDGDPSPADPPVSPPPPPVPVPELLAMQRTEPVSSSPRDGGGGGYSV